MPPTSAEDWKVIEVEEVLMFRVPPDAEEQHLQAVDTVVDVINGSGYEIIYEYGLFGVRIDQYKDQTGYTLRERNMDGQRAQEASFWSQNSELPVVRMLQIALEQGNILTLRLFCVAEATCEVYNELFDSVTLN